MSMFGLQTRRPVTLVLLTGSVPECMDRFCGPPVLLLKVYRGAFPVDNSAGKRDADHTAISRVEVKNSLKYITYMRYDKSYGRQ
jgi:hypothetical protein